MSAKKRYRRFTLRRAPFWLFLLAGISALSLAPLFIKPLTVSLITCLSVAVIIVTVAARFRDIGCSAWYTPLAASPVIAMYAGVTASDDQPGHPDSIEPLLLGTFAASFTLFVSWIAYQVVHI